MLRIVFLIAVLSLTGCASYFKKKDCEAINWFEHGKKVALRGEWLNSDKTVMECRQVEANIQESQLDQGFKNGMERYCSPTVAYQTGKSGDFFSRDLCEGPQINVLINEHKKGVKDYCAKSNGYTAGSSGKKYQNICPKDLEPTFLVEYRKGRKKYVQAMVENRQDDVRNLESKISQKQSSLNFTRGRLMSMESEKNSLETQKNYTPLQNTSQMSYLESRISTLNNDIMNLRSTVYSSESEVKELEKQRNGKLTEISEFKAELPSLD